MRRPIILLPVLALLTLLSLPALAQAASSFKWNSAIRLEPISYGGLDAVSCPNTQLCVAGDASGHIVDTTRPNGGHWSAPTKVDADGGAITGVSCPTTSFCAAVDTYGAFVSSDDPTGGSRAWTHPFRIDPTASAGGGWAGLAAISCPSTSLCVAVDNASNGNSNVVYSTDPTAGKTAWHTTALSGQATSVDCPSTTLCVIGGSTRWVSTSPASATGWKAATPVTGELYQSVDCVGINLCIGVGYGNTTPGFSAATKTPTGAWSGTYQVETNPPPTGGSVLDGVSCTRGTCVAVDGADNAFTTSATSGVWGAGAAIRAKSISQWNAISCTSGICVVVDSAGVETTGVS